MSSIRASSQLAGKQGTLWVSARSLTLWRRIELDLLLLQCSSNLSYTLFCSDFALAFHRAHNPVPPRVDSQWKKHPSSYDGDHNSSEMAGAPPVCRWARTTRTTVPITRGGYCSSEHTPRLGFWSTQFPAICYIDHSGRGTGLTPSIRSTLPVSALNRISSPPAGRMDHSAAELPRPHPSDLFTPRLASLLHSTFSRTASTSPKNARRPVPFCALRS